MENSIKKFLQFNGKNIYFKMVDGIWWVAIKPICQALKVDYERQRKNLFDDEILAQLPSEQTVVAADGRLRKMICLPEYFIYGWIFSIQSNSPELTAYKMKCYEILFNHFHGVITKRRALLTEIQTKEIEYTQWQIRLKETEAHQELLKIDRWFKSAGKQLKELDENVVSEQMTIWDN